MTLQGHTRSIISIQSDMRVYDFLLVINSNVGRIYHRFRDIASFRWKMHIFPTPFIQSPI